MSTESNPVVVLASASMIKELIVSGTITHDDGIVRCDQVLARASLKDGKRARWTRLREWIVTESTKEVA